MNEQVYGVFTKLEDAEQAMAALRDHGASGNEVSVVRAHDGAGVPQIEHDASHGITTTSPDDVVAGAVKGGAVGLGLGVLAAAVALTIPGIGPILAAGPIAAAIGAATATTAAGVLGGGVVGWLVDQGVPTDAANRYGHALGSGGVLVAVRSPHLSTVEAVTLLQKYGAVDIETHAVGEPVRGMEPPIVDRTSEVEGVPRTQTI
jgi:hypothetical protein